jgi:8-oxo-dGTP pyrophosphatase MutT (NUDIX family)
MPANRIMDILYVLQKSAWRVFRPRTRGVKVMLFNANSELVLIRNTYGRSDHFVLPGGGVRPFENPAVAAAREVEEELGLAVSELKLRSRHSSSFEGKRDEIHLFEAVVEGAPELDQFEVKEARFVGLECLPSATSPATRRRIEEYLGRREPDGSW